MAIHDRAHARRPGHLRLLLALEFLCTAKTRPFLDSYSGSVFFTRHSPAKFNAISIGFGCLKFTGTGFECFCTALGPHSRGSSRAGQIRIHYSQMLFGLAPLENGVGVLEAFFHFFLGSCRAVNNGFP